MYKYCTMFMNTCMPYLLTNLRNRSDYVVYTKLDSHQINQKSREQSTIWIISCKQTYPVILSNVIWVTVETNIIIFVRHTCRSLPAWSLPWLWCCHFCVFSVMTTWCHCYNVQLPRIKLKQVIENTHVIHSIKWIWIYNVYI